MWELSPTAARSTFNGGRSRASLLPLHGCRSGADPDRCSRTPASRPTRASSQRRRRHPHVQLSASAGMPSRAAFERASVRCTSAQRGRRRGGCASARPPEDWSPMPDRPYARRLAGQARERLFVLELLVALRGFRTPPSIMHQFQPSPGAIECRIGCPAPRVCSDACWFGELSQQPTSPQL
jgi:hypothetical protein